MVKLNKIYTRTGDKGTTGLGTGERRSKADLRIEAFGTVDEANSCIGMARIHTGASHPEIDAMLARIQNEMFDLGADLCVPDTGKDPGFEPLRVTRKQAERLEQEIDALNADLEPLRSFVLPGGHPAAAHLHLARTVSRRAERFIVALADRPDERISASAMAFINRLSDFFFVASRWVNHQSGGDVLWVKGENR